MEAFSPERFQIKELKFKPYINEDTIEKRVLELGQSLSKVFENETPIVIGVLNGAFMFMSDLIRCMNIPCEIDFWKLSSYGDEKVSSGEIDELKSLDANLEERQVILVEDIVDTGLSMNYMLDKLALHNPTNVTTVTLLQKTEAMQHKVQLDYVGFKIPDYFVVGYGLDYAQQGRNLPHIYIKEEN